ncbi:MAG: hypothetical protein ACOZB3_03395 [Calditrichota bacterium]
MKAIVAALVGVTLISLFWGCDLMDGKFNENQAPEVYLVNVPFDSSTFNYAPVVHWTGFDPDGQVTYFQYRYQGDTTAAAVAAYAAWIAGDQHALTNYCDGLPESYWEPVTESTEDTIYLRRNDLDTLTQTIFMVRCFDDQGKASLVKGRIFSRTNLAPYAPLIRWSLDAALDNPVGFQHTYNVDDTLFWGDTLTSTYSGIGFLWQGRDPDSRELNIITLRFSYLLVNEAGDTLPYAIRDSNRVVGYRMGWSDTTTTTQLTFSMASIDTNWYRAHTGRSFQFDSRFTFMVEVFDDGFTKSDTMAVAHFTAVRPLYNNEDVAKQLLIVDWNRTPTTVDYQFGLMNDDSIRAFYDQVIPEGFQVGEQLRQILYNFPGGIETPFDYDTQVEWYTADKDLSQAGRVPYDYIRKFKWIWVIVDNPPRTNPELSLMEARIKVFQDYMNIGGQVMISGRRIFSGLFFLNATGPLGADKASLFFRNYFNISTIYPGLAASANTIADFGGVTTTANLLVNMDVDTHKVHELNFRNRRYYCLPEIDYFGRSSSSSTSSDYSETLFNYQSCTAADTYNVYNEDCSVNEADGTPAVAYLVPLDNHDRILDVTRIYNVTRGVYGELMWWDQNGPNGAWQIVTSTPISAGQWMDSDVIEVDYVYIPIATSHDQPVASVFVKIQGVVEIVNGNVFFSGRFRYRSSFSGIPYSLMKNDVPVQIDVGPFGTIEASPVALMIARALIYFNEPRRVQFGGDNQMMRSTPLHRAFN